MKPIRKGRLLCVIKVLYPFHYVRDLPTVLMSGPTGIFFCFQRKMAGISDEEKRKNLNGFLKKTDKIPVDSRLFMRL